MSCEEPPSTAPLSDHDVAELARLRTAYPGWAFEHERDAVHNWVARRRNLPQWDKVAGGAAELRAHTPRILRRLVNQAEGWDQTIAREWASPEWWEGALLDPELPT